jgi:HSP20 family protein
VAFGLTPWDPFREFDRLDRLMRRGFEMPFARGTETIGAPAVEVTDEGDHYLVKAEIPGVAEEDVDITLTGNVLTLRGEKRYERKARSASEEKSEGAGEAKAAKKGEAAMAKRGEQGLAQADESRPIFSEVYYGRFERVLTLPDDIDAEKIEASSRNGVFTIEIGKKAQQRARRIQVTRH